MADNQTPAAVAPAPTNGVDLAKLEADTNAEQGWRVDEPEKESTTTELAIEVEPAKASEPTPSAEKPAEPTPEKPVGQVDKTANLKKIFDETPYKAEDIEESAKKMVEGYKNMESVYTKVNTKIKAIEPIVDAANSDPNFKQFLEQAYTLYKNPQMAQAYLNPQAEAPPNPQQYDMYTPEGYAKFQQDWSNYNQRQLDQRLNARLAEGEQRVRLETQKGEFARRYPNVTDPDSILKEIQTQAPNLNPYEVAYKVREFDNIASKALETARKELSTKMETAQTTKTPQATSSPSSKPAINDVLNHVAKYGQAASEKRYGKEAVQQAIEIATNADFAA